MGSQTITSLDAIAEVQKYTLISDDIFLREFDASNVPDWYKTMVDNAISNSATINDLASLINMLQGIVDGYTMRLYSVETSNENMHTLLTTLSSSLGAAQAAILNLDITKVTPTEALAISREVVGAYFNSDAGAWFDSKITAYASAVEAFASNISTLAAVLGNQTVRLDTIDSVLVTTEGWAASASKLITAPDGSITGWSFGDGSNTESEFKIHSNNFSISDGTTGYTPFSIVGSDIQFNGTVSFTNVTDAPPIPDSTSDLINNSGYTTLPIVAAQGYVLPAGVANAINTNTTTIDGSKITTGSVNAAVLSATAIYGKTINITDSSASGGIMPSGTSSLGYFDTSRDQNALGAVNRAYGGYGISGIGTNTTSSVGVHGRGIYGVLGETTNASGYWGLMTHQKCYSGQGFSSPVTTISFTGGHTCFADTDITIGDILEVSSGYLMTIDQSYTIVTTTTTSMSKKVFGVASKINDDVEVNLRDYAELHEVTDNSAVLGDYKEEYLPFINNLVNNGYKDITSNSLGEGGINVCSDGGNIEIGDYICSSNNKGKGMKQDDDLLHNYTVAKALESVDWTTEQSTTKMIACTYHCG